VSPLFFGAFFSREIGELLGRPFLTATCQFLLGKHAPKDSNAEFSRNFYLAFKTKRTTSLMLSIHFLHQLLGIHITKSEQKKNGFQEQTSKKNC